MKRRRRAQKWNLVPRRALSADFIQASQGEQGRGVGGGEGRREVGGRRAGSWSRKKR